MEYLDHLPFLTIYGGKLTTFRKLSENVLSKLKDFFPEMGHDWTMKKPLPGGDFLVNEKKEVINEANKIYDVKEVFPSIYLANELSRNKL